MVPLVEARGVSRIYQSQRGLFGKVTPVKAVDHISLSIGAGETLGIVGESGSGKSTLGRLILGAEQPQAGSVLFKGQGMPPRGSEAWRAQRAQIQMIYQDPLGALDRRLTIAEQLREPLDIHSIGNAKDRAEMVETMLHRIGFSQSHACRYPHELSGGQRQRAVMARALMSKPDLLVCDEPVSALDVSIQAQVVNLLEELQQEFGLAMLFISHDLRVVRQISQRVAVMYLGNFVEEGDADSLFLEPLHPYTRALVSAAPVVGRNPVTRIRLEGEPPNPAARPSGCAFHPRCPLAQPRCRVEVPALTAMGKGRRVACHEVAPAAQTQRVA